MPDRPDAKQSQGISLRLMITGVFAVCIFVLYLISASHTYPASTVPLLCGQECVDPYQRYFPPVSAAPGLPVGLLD